MKNAFLLIVHSNYDQLLQMMKCLDYADNDFYIHVNSLVNNIPYGFLESEISAAKIKYVKRHEIYWGGGGILEASIELLKSAYSGGKYDYFHLLTGEDLPIKSYAEFRAFLEENLYLNESAIYKTNYIGGSVEFDKKVWARVAHYNFGVKHWRDKNPLYREFWKKTNRLLYYLQRGIGINRLRTQKMQLTFGSPWWSISDEFAFYVIDHENLLRKYYTKKWTFGADEFGIQTLFHNSKLCTSVYRPPEGRSANLREIDFERGNGLGSPYTWQMEDYETLTHSKNYFARKFSKSLDEDVIVRILDYVKMRSEEL